MEKVLVLDSFDTILTDTIWQVGGFPLPDGTFWTFREPDAVVIVRNGILYTRARLSRSHDSIQFLDNAKHMYYSVETFPVEGNETISFELQIRGRTQGTVPGDLYDGFVSLNLMDFSTGAALDFFVGNDMMASVYAILPFPGVTVPQTDKTRFFCIFKESAEFAAREFNTYRITYCRGSDEIIYFVNGKEVRRENDVPVKFNGFRVALGIMTEKDISPEGSTSLHGQTVIGEWSPIRISYSDRGSSAEND